jgi:hypothetical protein
MNLLGLCGSLHQALQKGDEVLAGVPRRRHPLNLAGLHVQRRVQRERSMAIVFEALPFGAAGRQRQHRVEPCRRHLAAGPNASIHRQAFVVSRARPWPAPPVCHAGLTAFVTRIESRHPMLFEAFASSAGYWERCSEPFAGSDPIRNESRVNRVKRNVGGRFSTWLFGSFK